MLFNVDMKKISEIRRDNLLIALARMGAASKLASVAGVSAVYLSQVKNRSPESKTGKPKTMGDDVARKIEVALSEPEGWMDTPHSPSAENESNVSPGPNLRGQVPLISWVQAGAFCESPDAFAPGDAEKWLACPVAHGPYTYCLRVVGRSMDSDDGYREGEILYVDPGAEALPGADVIVRSPDGMSTFKRLKQDMDGIYLLALNPNWHERYIKMPEGSHICGVVIFSGRER